MEWNASYLEMATTAPASTFTYGDTVLLFGILGAILLLIALLLVGTGARISVGVFLCLLASAISGCVVLGITNLYLNDGSSDYTYRMTGGGLLLALSVLLIIGLYGWFGWYKSTNHVANVVHEPEHHHAVAHKEHEKKPHHHEKKRKHRHHHEKKHVEIEHRHKKKWTDHAHKKTWKEHRKAR